MSQREIERRTGVDRKTLRKYDRLCANSLGVATGSVASSAQIPPPRSPGSESCPEAFSEAAHLSACERHRAWIEAEVRLGYNAVSIYQNRVEQFCFAHAYNSVKRFVAAGCQ